MNEIERHLTLINQLSEFGTVEVVKEGYVFTLLLTGNNLTKAKVFIGIQKILLSIVGDKYPMVEVVKNTDTYFLVIMHPEKRSFPPAPPAQKKTV